MDNAAKALIMAGGMLLAMLIVGLLLFSWNIYSNYQSSQLELAEIDDKAKFNEQFTNYQRDDVQGYELLSLINRIIDYNERKSNSDTINGNNQKSNYVTITIQLENSATSETNRKKLTYDDNIKLFNEWIYEANQLTSVNNGSRPSFKNDIENTMKNGLEACGITETESTNLAKKISSIFMTEDQVTARANSKYRGDKTKVYAEMVAEFNSCVSNRIIDGDYNNLLLKGDKSSKTGNKYYEYACKFYEYMQFKRAIFKCTDLEYDDITGRVKSMKFEFSGIN